MVGSEQEGNFGNNNYDILYVCRICNRDDVMKKHFKFEKDLTFGVILLILLLCLTTFGVIYEHMGIIRYQYPISNLKEDVLRLNGYTFKFFTPADGYTDGDGNIAISKFLSKERFRIVCNHEVCHNIIDSVNEEEICSNLANYLGFPECEILVEKYYDG